MSRNRPRSLNLRTPVGGIYGNTLRYSPNRRSPSPRRKPRYCRECSNSFYPVVPSPLLSAPVMSSPAFYPVPYMIPMMYAPPPPILYDEPIQLPEPPYPNYETDETDSYDLDDMRTATEETLSTMHRSIFRRSDGNLVRDFEETDWVSVGDNMKNVQEMTLRKSQWFQRSIELPHGVITRLKCERLPVEASGNSTLRKQELQRLNIVGRVRQWSPTLRAINEEDFSEVLILPQGTDWNTLSYKLQTKNAQQYSEQNFNRTLRHHSTSYNGVEEQPYAENTVVVTGRVERQPQQEVNIPVKTWSKEYKQTVRGTVDLSPEGRVVNPTITSYSELPESLIKFAPTPDQDTSYSILDNGCQIRIRLGDRVDRNGIRLEADPRNETLKVKFSSHAEERTNGYYTNDDPSGTTNYDTQVDQTFNFSANKFNIDGVTKRIQGDDLFLFIPFAHGFHPSSLNM